LRPKNPFPAYRFKIRIGTDDEGGFSECSGLGIETEVVEYREGGLNDRVHRFPGSTRHSNLVLRRGIVDRGLYDWYRATVEGQLELKDGNIAIFDESGTTTVMAWGFANSFPCKWVGPDLNALESRVAVETFELCHEGLVRIE